MSSTLLQILPCRAEYDSRLESTELHTLRFLVDTLRREPPLERALEFGAGSTLHHAIALAARTRELHPPTCCPATCAPCVAGFATRRAHRTAPNSRARCCARA